MSTEIRSDVQAIVELVHRIGREIVEPAAAEVDREARFPTESFAALRAEKLLSAYVPAEYGGMGLSHTDVCRICEVLGQYCASTAMVYAMHQIQVACIVHHGQSTPFFRSYMREWWINNSSSRRRQPRRGLVVICGKVSARSR